MTTSAVTHKAEIEKAYADIVAMAANAEQIEVNMKPFFRYSPFNHLPFIIKHELSDIRKKLIEQVAQTLNDTYLPNCKEKTNFIELTNEELGKDAFSISLIENWFLVLTKDPEKVSKMSLEYLRKMAHYFVPWGEDEKGYRGPMKDWRKLLEKPDVLIFRAGTKSYYSHSEINPHFNNNDECAALEKIIEIATRRKDPATVTAPGWLTNIITEARRVREPSEVHEPRTFWTKHEVHHPTVKAFQFFKNDKFKIWFRRPYYAELVAQTLIPPHKKVS